MRTGKPCARGSGSPFMATAKIASRLSSRRTSSGVLAVQPSWLVDSTMSAPAWGPAFFSSSRIGWPSQTALPIRLPPISFDTHISVATVSVMGSASSSS